MIVEQAGRLVSRSADGSTSTLLDITDQVSFGGERGLLSVAFDPEFEKTGLLYVDYTDRTGDTRVVEYMLDEADPAGTAASGAAVDPASARPILRIAQPFENPNGGQLQFGPDGRLYVGMGDGGSGGDPSRNGQDPETELGKLLAVDPATPDSTEIVAKGLRNPWRFSFDRDGDAIAIGDVGQDNYEEVDIIAFDELAGANFGWSAYEGTARFNHDQTAEDAIDPVYQYDHDVGCSITGGYVVRDRRLPSLFGRYLYGDFCSGVVSSFSSRPGEPADDNRTVGLTLPQLSSFGEDRTGRIYLASLDGPVYRLDPNRTGAAAPTTD